MSTESFLDLRVWQRAMDLMQSCYVLGRMLPSYERYGIVSQLQRASLSVASNISEGNGRRTRGEYLNQLSVAQGSLNEVHTLLLAIGRLGYARDTDIASRIDLVYEVGRMLGGLRRAIALPRSGPRGR